MVKKHNLNSDRDKHRVNEKISSPYIVRPMFAFEAYEFALDYFDKDVLDEAIIHALTKEQMADCLTRIFDEWDFEEWLG